MDSATEDIYLQKIEEFVYDQDKIVTFRWLCSTLSISSVDSKRLLEKYVNDHRVSKPTELAVTYVLSGMIEEDTLSFAVVKEHELEDKRDELIKVLSQQIYSVQKCKQIDLNAVSLVDYFDMHDPLKVPIIGSVISKNCVKRVFKPKKALPPPRQPTVKGKSSFFTKLPAKSTKEVDAGSTGNISTSNSESTSVKEIATENTSKQSSVKEGTAKPKQNGIASFFTKGATSKTDLKPKAPEKGVKMEEKQPKAEDIQQTELDTKDRMKGLIDSDSELEDIISPTPNLLTSKENQKPKRNYKRQKKENQKNAPSAKRRKRIVEHNNSDSDDIFGNDEEDVNTHEDVIENLDEDSEPVFKSKPPLAPKNKKRKFVDRTFTDEDGYIITRKEWVEESPSEDETTSMEVEAIQPEKKETKVEVKIISEIKKSNKSENDNSSDKVMNGKTKGSKGKKQIAANQKTLMSFFQKK